MITLNIDNLNLLIKSNVSILEACKYIGINIPKFCYHESLSVAGNCRMCLVELQKTPKPVASCAMPVVNNMVVFTSTPLVKKARENVLETLLINHPLDCPICDQGGECDLQDETKNFGIDTSRYYFNKRSVEDKNCGSVIKTIMTRCIHCTRCVRFSTEIAGTNFFGTINRGTNTEISNYISNTFNSFLSGNVIDLCPVGALTSKNYAFKARPWELKSIETIDLTDGSGSSVYFNYKESEIVRIIPKINKEINDNWISDRIRFSFDSFTNSRLHSVFEQNKENKFIKTNWNFVIKNVRNHIINNNKKVTFLINNEIDLQSLVFLKKIQNFSKKKILILNSEVKENNNLYTNWLTNKINDIKKTGTCFLFFVNIHLENIVINTKLKVKYNQKKTKVFNFGNLFNSTFPINFSNISIKELVLFFESKLKIISKALVEFSNPLIVLGESFSEKLSNQQFAITYLKKIIVNCIILNVKTKANSESVNLLNIYNNNTSSFNKSNFLVSINLADSLNLRKFFDKSKENVWLNPYGSAVATKNKYILPTLNYAEEKNIYLNLEQRPQQTSILFTKINNTKSTKFFLKYILNYIAKKDVSYTYKNLNFLQEMVNNLDLFKKIKNKMTNSFVKIVYKDSKEFIFLSDYKTKSILEDFFLINNFCKNSLVMNNLSLDYRKSNSNFFF